MKLTCYKFVRKSNYIIKPGSSVLKSFFNRFL